MLPGRLAEPSMCLGSDPRTDPRIAAALAGFGLDGEAPPSPLTVDAPREALLEFIAAAEAGFQAMFEALSTGLAPVAGVSVDAVRILAADGHEIPLTIHRPARTAGSLPLVVHLHGGGMALLTAADPVYARERDALAATGVIVIGVEFRNAGGMLGNHPYPAGLDDCVDAVRWTLAHRQKLAASGAVVSGESGGGNLTLALSHRAKREGWLDQIAGFYAQCPYIYGDWRSPPDELRSMRENDGYFVRCDVFALLSEAYDPGAAHMEDRECWPFRAGVDDLRGMPPHVVSVNELDPLRDEGLAYYRRLVRAGVSTVGRVVAGTCHGGDLLFPGSIPEVYSASPNDVSSFARSVVAQSPA